MKWYIKVWKNALMFRGRAQRAEYWNFVLFNMLISSGLIFVDTATGNLDPATGTGLFWGIYSLAAMLPGAAVTVRRLHDTNRSGWWFLLFFSIFLFCLLSLQKLSDLGLDSVGAALFLLTFLTMMYFLAQDGTPGENAYGPNPKGCAAKETDPFAWAYNRPGAPRRPDSPEDPLDRLEKLADLKARGIISEEEFNEQKQKLLK